MQILLIEDEPKTLAFIRKGLEENGYAVDTAADGQEGLRLAMANAYQMIISDIVLPGISGITLCRQLRSLQNQTPLLMLTALGGVGHVVEGLDSGADDYLVKPFEFQELLARIRTLTKRGASASQPAPHHVLADLELNSQHAMHPTAIQYYLEMDSTAQKRVQVLLCQQALQVWEQLVPTNLTYRESVVGTEQELDASLPRAALVAVVSGQNAKAIKARYLEPIVALEDEDIVLPKRAEFAYYAIYNLFSAQVLQQPLDPWLVPNQALAAMGDDAAASAWERALGAP